MKQVAGLILESPSKISKAIQIGNMRPANHAAVEFCNDQLVFEALFHGIEVTHTNIWYPLHDPKTVIHKVTFNVEDTLYNIGVDTAWSKEKDKYNFAQYVTFLPVTRALFGRFVKDNDKAWVCSEFYEFLFRTMGINFIHQITKPSDVSPGDLLDSIRFEMGIYQRLTGDDLISSQYIHSLYHSQ